MSSAPPSTVPPAELRLLGTTRRVTTSYSAYPPPQSFHADFAAGEGSRPAWLSPLRGTQAAHALYVHLPFCYTACVFCHCNKIVTRDGGKATRYLGFLERDIALQAMEAGSGAQIARMHWGGGTPTYHTLSQLRRLWQVLRSHFVFADAGEYTIEIDPRTVDESAVMQLRDMGFTAAAIFVPDLAPGVLEAITRPQLPEQSLGAIAAARHARFATVAVEVMCGLPLQTAASFTHTVSEVVSQDPDRVMIKEYIHDPRRHKIQRQVSFNVLPRAAERLEMAGLAVERLTSVGYVQIGPDCFVRPGDPLHTAQQAGLLGYDLLGYTVHRGMTIIPVGASAIGSTGLSYSQNEPDLGTYYDRVGAGSAPVARVCTLHPDDHLRRTVIENVLCQGRVPFAALEKTYSIAFERYFASELRELVPYAVAGLLSIVDREIVLEPRGLLWARSICAVFDRYQDEPA